VEAAIPPLKILLHIMAYGHYNGKDLNDPELRERIRQGSCHSIGMVPEKIKLKQQKDSAF
jgi:phosphoenolpyruvate carboxykinase (diphosphate)